MRVDWLAQMRVDWRAHPGLKNRILLNYTRIENAHKVRKKTFDVAVIFRSPAHFQFSFFPAETQEIDASMLTTAGFELVKQFCATEIGRPNAANAVSACADQPQQTK